MNPSERESTDLLPDDRRWIETIAESYRTSPLSPSERVIFDERLQARIHRRRRGLAAGWMAAAAAVVALAALLVWSGPSGPAPEDTLRLAGGWSEDGDLVSDYGAPESLFVGTASNDPWTDEDEDLPDEYAAIAGLLLADL
ncbi:MAG: hypothetical protein ACQGVK_25450 [Myxococcota bacterium]